MKRIFISLMIVAVGFSLANCQNKKIADGGVSSGGLNSVYYDYDQDFIRSDAASTLQGNASYLKANSSGNVKIEGHCDERGTNEYNLALGQRRSQSSKNYLTNLGINPSRMTTVSFGEEKPVCYESNDSCWQRNRRADFRK